MIDYDERAEKVWMELYEEYKNKSPLSSTRKLWVSEWSWTPMCDGIFPFQHYLYPYFQIKDGIIFYATGTNYRVYAIWDLFNKKPDCQKLCDEKNKCGYSWEILYQRKLTEYGLQAAPNRMEELGWSKKGG